MDELEHLLSQLGLGTASAHIYDTIMDLDTGGMTVPELEQAIHGVLALNGFEPCAEAVISALREVGYAGLASRKIHALGP